MNIEITGINVEVTEALKQLSNKKLAKLTTFDSNILRVQLVLKLENYMHTARATVHTKGKNLIAHAESQDMYKTIDLILEKLVNQMKNRS